MIHFNVYGKRLSVQRENNGWSVFKNNGTGLIVKETSICIPEDIKESELGQYFSDLFHELASEEYPNVVRLN
ncbi:hypothetical protein [Pleionea sp. CnH1-48]|uniref:DUF7661 family protein n=1 Tax=Pleionea sp. CnH1-48 TaxID=2954494 RepID=UPI002096F36F|nr:hypothetical protein [Pleionea sp. CnH1-48]MCO7223931.1 hypothetical protein [Pleionea sp. CnH1-48]